MGGKSRIAKILRRLGMADLFLVAAHISFSLSVSGTREVISAECCTFKPLNSHLLIP
jgi:hypothetical protein